MSKQYSVADARKSLPNLIRDAESGYDVEITRRGRLVAVLLSSEEYQRLKGHRRRFKQIYADFLDRFDPAEVGLDDDFILSLRDQSTGREVDL